MEWVNVEERLPETSELVLVFMVNGNDGFMPCYNSQSVDCWKGEYWHKCKGVTHWMPLPPPPQLEKKEG